MSFAFTVNGAPVEVEATGALWVGCDTGDTSMRISRRRPATS